MNLITCSEDCKYQEEGYCNLYDSPVVTSSKVGGCNYYKKRDKKANKKQKGL